MDNEAKKQRLRESSLRLSLHAEAMPISGVKHGELDLYRSARDLRIQLAKAGALIEVHTKRKG
jgi:hypothetical protein